MTPPKLLTRTAESRALQADLLHGKLVCMIGHMETCKVCRDAPLYMLSEAENFTWDCSCHEYSV